MCLLESTTYGCSKENEKLKDFNDKLYKTNYCLQESYFDLSIHVKHIRKESSDSPTENYQAILDIIKVLKERINQLTQEISKFVKGISNLNRLIGSHKSPCNKTGALTMLKHRILRRLLLFLPKRQRNTALTVIRMAI